MKLSESLVRHCKARGLSISKLAKEAGVPMQTLHGWTAGRKAVNLDHLKKIAAYLQVPLHDLIYGERDPHEAPSEEILRELFSGDLRVIVQKIERRRIEK